LGILRAGGGNFSPSKREFPVALGAMVLLMLHLKKNKRPRCQGTWAVTLTVTVKHQNAAIQQNAQRIHNSSIHLTLVLR